LRSLLEAIRGGAYGRAGGGHGIENVVFKQRWDVPSLWPWRARTPA